jgi:tetratricopeptide (TPR) repeat protein
LVNLANAYCELGNHDRAIANYHQALVIATQIGDRWGESLTLSNLGDTLIKLENYTEARHILRSALDITQDIKARSLEASVLKKLAVLHQAEGDINGADDFCDRALSIATELDLPLAQDCRELKERLYSIKNPNK